MFGWLFGKRKPVRKILLLTYTTSRIYSVYESQSGFVVRWCGDDYLLLKSGAVESKKGWRWYPYSGWPLDEFPIVKLEPAS